MLPGASCRRLLPSGQPRLRYRGSMKQLRCCRCRLAYEDRVQEACFAQFYGLQYQSTNLLLCLLLSVIWCIRGYYYYFQTQSTAGSCLAVLSLISILLQLHQIWNLLQYPSTCCSEGWKGYMFVADLLACTVAVILTAGCASAPLTSSAIVYTVHSWFAPFTGFRMSAACFLHVVNIQCYAIMRFCEVFSGDTWSIRSLLLESLMLLAINFAVPMLINIGYEARQRSRFSEKAEHECVKPVWAWILSLQCTPNKTRPLDT